MDKIIGRIAGLGVPGLALLLAINATGFAGAAALTTALASFGPGGMFGGLITLGFIGVISSAIAEYGFDAIFAGVIKELYKKGESYESIRDKINRYPLSKGLKRKLLDQLDNLVKNDERDKVDDDDPENKMGGQ